MPRRKHGRTPILRYEDGCPVIAATLTPSGRQQTFYCEYCHANHFHGYMDGHRSAHCTNPVSPFRATGYVLERQPAEGGAGPSIQHGAVSPASEAAK
jgi:hypothetical protein